MSGSIRFAGLPIHPLSVDETIQVLADRPATAPFGPYVTPNMEHIYLSHRYAEVKAVFENGLANANDSRILHRLGKLGGLELKLAPGAYVVDRLFRASIKPDDSICVIGATDETVAIIRRQFGLTHMVQHIPPMGFIDDEAAVRAAIDFIVAHPSRYVMVATGMPQSERFCTQVMQDGRATGIGLCIGSSLLVLAGQGYPAPDWMEQNGLVWLYRLVREPGRLWKRYLVHDLYGALVCLGDILALRLGLRRADA
jgi:exopolysaccharide biosynthesis WecB/TagA/CpsF family protein